MKKEIEGLSIFLFMLVLLFAMTGISAADFEGTIGTRFTITDSGFGMKKPKVYIEYEKNPGVVKKVYTKVETWSDTSITCLWTINLPAGTYNLWVQPNIKKATPLSEGTFTIMNPGIDEVTPDTLTSKATITINGHFFTNKKPSVYLKDLVSQKRKRCRVLISSMDAATGASSLYFIVPNLGSTEYEIILETRVGQASTNPFPLNNWHLRLEKIPQLSFSNIVYGNGMLVMISDKGYFLTSVDGTAWTIRNSGVDKSLSGLAFGNGIFVAVGENGTIVTSQDTITWTIRNSGVSDSIAGITYGGGIFIAVAPGGTDLFPSTEILISTDGVHWTNEQVNYRLSSAAYGSGLFVVVGENGIILTSSGFNAWTLSDSGTTASLNKITYVHDIFIVIVNGTYLPLTSSDGKNWTTENSKYLSNAVYGNGIFVTATANCSQDGIIVDCDYDVLTSPDGINWTTSSTLINVRSIFYGGGKFYALSENSPIHGNGTVFISSSVDATNWKTRDMGAWVRSYQPNSFCYASYLDNTYILLTHFLPLLLSNDAVTWEIVGVDPQVEGFGCGQITSGKGISVAIKGTNIFTLSDGRNWTMQDPITPEYLYGIVYADGIFVAVGSGGTVLTSADGTTWSLRNSDTRYNLNGVAFGNGIFVAVGTSGAVLTSQDGVVWVLRNIGIQSDFSNITFGNGIFILDNSLKSADGVTWSDLYPATVTPTYFLGTSFGNGYFVAVDHSNIYSSTDGTTWVNRYAMGGCLSSSVSFVNNTFMVSCDSRILQSDPL